MLFGLPLRATIHTTDITGVNQMKACHCLRVLLLCLVVSLQAREEAQGQDERKPVASALKKARRSFGGFEKYEFKLDGHRCILVKPGTLSLIHI